MDFIDLAETAFTVLYDKALVGDRMKPHVEEVFRNTLEQRGCTFFTDLDTGPTGYRMKGFAPTTDMPGQYVWLSCPTCSHGMADMTGDLYQMFGGDKPCLACVVEPNRDKPHPEMVAT